MISVNCQIMPVNNTEDATKGIYDICQMNDPEMGETMVVSNWVGVGIERR